jgi:hypothetical protein
LRDIDAVRLVSARPTINLQASRVDDVIEYATSVEQAVEPEAVIARFVARDHFHALRRQFSSDSRLDPRDQLQKTFPITRLQRVATDLV